MINKYDFTLSDPDTFKVFSVKDMLFLCWICPQVDSYLKLFNHFNEIVFTAKPHPGKNIDEFIQQTNNSRIQVRSELWEVIDSHRANC